MIHLISGGDTGGAKTHVHSLLRNLSRGMDVTLVCFRDGPFAREAAELGIDTRVCEGGFFSALRQGKKLIAEEGFELVHTHGSRANLAGAILRSGCGRPVVSTVHSDYRLDYMGRPLAGATYGVLNVLALRRIKYHVGVSDAMRDLLISRRFPRETTFAIYNGLDFTREPKRLDRAAFCERVGAQVGPGDVVVGAAARLDPVKDLATLVRGFALARRQHPELKLIIAGEGPERPNLLRLAEELGARDAVCLAGWLDDMEEFYSALDINSLSSLSETFPYALTEGAAYRLPTVASAVGGIPRLIEDGKTGYLFRPGDHETLAARLSELGIEHRPIAGTGVLAKIEGRGKADPKRRAVVLRADIDALPIDERNDADWSSRNQGVMHACGHDMHAAVLFGVLKTFAEAPDFRGTLFGLFQPGEECNPGGASLVLAENPFDGYEVRAVVGEHVEPQLEVGTLGFRAGKYMASSDELRFSVHGTGGHGAMRPQLKDPVAAAAEFVTRLIALNHEECVLSIGRIEAGGATNIVPDEVYLEGTLRTFDEREREIIHQRIRNIAAEIDKRLGVRIAIDISHGYPCVVNDEHLVKQAAALAREEKLQVEMLPLRTTAEDFGFYCTKYPSLFYRLGVGAAAGRPHTATFNPDEGAINVGIGFMKRLALQILKK